MMRIANRACKKMALIFSVLLTSACNTTSIQDNSGTAAPVVGAIIGGVVGSQVASDGKRTKEAAIGAAAGAVAGYGIGQYGKRSSSDTLPFQTSKNLDAVYAREKATLKKAYNKNVAMLPSSKPFAIELYMQEELPNDGPEWDYKAILRIGDYYYPLRLGTGHAISIVDVKGDKGPEKILVLATGCFSDAGCMDLTYAIRAFADQPFTVTEFDGELLERKNAMSAADYKRLKSQGALLMHFYVYRAGNCALEDSAFELNGSGFRKIWNKQEKVECAG